MTEKLRVSAPWVARTYSGRMVNLLEPRAVDICIEDIAWHLSMLNRWTGGVRYEYSVAQHSVEVSLRCPVEYALQGLMHDAHEAYLGDWSRPAVAAIVEACAVMSRAGSVGIVIGDIKLSLDVVIAEKFAYDPVVPDLVREIDNRMLSTEDRDCMKPMLEGPWEFQSEPFEERIKPMSSRGARRAFMARFEELTS